MKIPFWEIAFALFLIAGQVKAFIRYFRVPEPIDLTLMSAGLIVLISVVKLILHGPNPWISRSQVRSCIFLALLIVWNGFTLFYTVSPQYSYEKLNLFVLIGMCFILPIVVKSVSPRHIIIFYTVIVIPLGIIFCQQMYTNYLSAYDERFTTFQANYLVLSELIGFSLICFIEKWWILPKKSWQLPMIILGLSIMLLLGARGPLLFLIICICIRFGLEIFKGNIKLSTKSMMRTFGVFVLSGLVLIGFYFTKPLAVERLFERTISRFSGIGSEFGQEERMGATSMTRVDLIDRAMDYSFESLGSYMFGQGIGGFGIRYLGVDDRAYPHNLFLEVLVETGFIGLLFLICFFVSIITSIHKNSVISYNALFYWLLNSLKSHTIVDLKVFFAALSLATLPVLFEESFNYVSRPRPQRKRNR